MTLQKRSTMRTLVLVGVLAAAVFVLSSLEIPIPIAGDKTRIHFGNIMCLLSGVLFGPLVGGMAAGLGSMIYDLTHPLYIAEFWITFLTKFAMGWLAGMVASHLPAGVRAVPRALAAGLAGQVLYIALYLGKTAIMQRFVAGLPWQGALVVVLGKAAVSGVNGLLAVAVCTALAPALQASLRAAGFYGPKPARQG